ncbi:MAG: hypothetical protein NC079_04820 [Clostridium sp.]|nr:hypothetical protein [Acetatifactor muris]MCM1526268.1 hypothetical protein [Bacteroides sp.]MCM1562915.1 hypothetical protein [Clostridium sp.]
MKKTENHFNNIGIGGELDMPRIRHLMKIGLVAAVMVLTGDMLLGYGAAETEVSGIPVTFARYLSVSDGRIFWSALLGMIGIPLECLCYFAIYRLIAHKSEKYAHTYRTGIFGCMILGGCGVHVPCCATVYFLKKMYELSPDTAFEKAVEFLTYFLAPATVLFLVFFFVLTTTQIKAFAKGLTPLPGWAWIFSVLFGLLAAVILKAPNLPFLNALATGWISIGNLWMFGGLLFLTKRRERYGDRA